MHREVLYYLAMGEYKLKRYGAAKRACDTLLSLEKDNKQVLMLKQEIDEKLKGEGIFGMAVSGVALLGIGLLVSSLFKKN